MTTTGKAARLEPRVGGPSITSTPNQGARQAPMQSVANGSGGRYELYCNYPLQIQAVAASVAPA
jgi:hypothetical protein